MLSELNTQNKIVGIKQLRKALRIGGVQKVFVALNADPKMISPIVEASREAGIPVEEAETMEILGKACGIEVGAAVAAIIQPE